MGRYLEAEQTIDQGIRLATENGFGELVFWMKFSNVALALLRGPARAVLHAAHSTVESAGELKTPFARCGIKLALGLAHYANGNFEDAIEELSAVPAICEETSAVRFFLPLALGYLAESLLEINQVDRAVETAREITDFCRPREARATLRPWLALAGAHIARRDEAAARAALEEAQQILDETACDGYEPFLYEVRAKFARAFEDEATAHAQRGEAHRLFVELGADEYAARIAGITS
jgi:tetratricopeptide (TPR) repeat protein